MSFDLTELFKSLSSLTDSGDTQEIHENYIIENINIDLINTISESLNSNLISNNMAQLKPEYFNCVPVFDGSPNDLNRFLTTCEILIKTFYDKENPNCFNNTYLMHSLINKLQGTAKLVVNIQSVKNWEDLKNTLYRNFADQRDEACLNRDLILLKQNFNETPQQYFDKCLNLLNLLCSYVDSHEENEETKNAKRELYSNLTLNTFLTGLKEPLGNTIRCMRPENINQALQFILQEQNVHYYQNLTNKVPMKPNNNFSNNHNNNNQSRYNNNFNQNRNGQHFRNFNQNNQQQNFNKFQQPNKFPTGPINIQSRPNFNKFYPTNSQVFNRNPNKQYNNQNAFRPNKNFKAEQATPMSTSTRQSFNRPQNNNRLQNHFQNQNQYNQRNYIAEEIYNAEVETNNDYQNFDNVEQNFDNVEQNVDMDFCDPGPSIQGT